MMNVQLYYLEDVTRIKGAQIVALPLVCRLSTVSHETLWLTVGPALALWACQVSASDRDDKLGYVSRVV